MPKRRPNHEGSFYYRKSDKRWVAVFNGQTQTDKDKAKARAKWDAMKLATLQGYNHRAAVDQVQTVEVLARRLFRSDMAKSTKVQYEAGLAYLLPYFGDLPIQKLTGPNVRKWLEQLDREHGTQKSRIRQVAYDLLRRACGLAEEEGLIAKNPCQGQTRPKSRRKPILPPTVDEARLILTASRGDREHVVIALALWAGLRPCEIFGLCWENIDWRRGTLMVEGAAVESGTVEMQDHSKTANSRREVPMITKLRSVLVWWRNETHGPNSQPKGLIVATRTGNPLSRSTFLHRYWKPMLEKLGLPVRPFYSCRHSCITLMIAAGIPIQVVAKVVGHKDVRTTWITYSHVMPGDAGKALNALSESYDHPTDPPEQD